MSIEMIDQTGKPRSDKELDEAIATVGKHIVKSIFNMPSDLFMQMTTIHSLLKELKVYRAVIAKAQAERAASEPAQPAPAGSEEPR
jgi:hypothetical protein